MHLSNAVDRTTFSLSSLFHATLHFDTREKVELYKDVIVASVIVDLDANGNKTLPSSCRLSKP